MDETTGAIESEMAMLLRLADRNRRSPALEPTLERSAYLVLTVLEQQPVANISTIAEALRLDASTVTRQVVAMEAATLVKRRRDPADGRGTLVVATPHGVAQLAATREVRSAVYADVLADWTFGDRQALAALLHRLNLDLDRYARRY